MQYVNYDLNDPQTRGIVETNHYPVERKEGAGTSAKLTIICIQCETQWPCEQIVNLRAWVPA